MLNQQYSPALSPVSELSLSGFVLGEELMALSPAAPQWLPHQYVPQSWALAHYGRTNIMPWPSIGSTENGSGVVDAGNWPFGHLTSLVDPKGDERLIRWVKTSEKSGCSHALWTLRRQSHQCFVWVIILCGSPWDPHWGPQKWPFVNQEALSCWFHQTFPFLVGIRSTGSRQSGIPFYGICSLELLHASAWFEEQIYVIIKDGCML